MKNLLFLIVLCLSSIPAFAGDLYVAAAADLVYCLTDINAAFVKANPGTNVIVSTGSSGRFYSQVQNGAPFEVYLSADMTYPRKLADEGYADKKTLLQYAVGRIVLWSVAPSVDVSKGMQVLVDPAVKHVSLANPEHAPYGVAGKAAMQNAGVYSAVVPKLVTAENVSQAAQYVLAGSVEVGIVALSLVKSPALEGKGKYWTIPADQHSIIEQGGVVTRKGMSNPMAERYLSFLGTPGARVIFDRYGFILPVK